jgi:hypothetical protein
MEFSFLCLFIFEMTVWCIAIEMFRAPDEREEY